MFTGKKFRVLLVFSFCAALLLGLMGVMSTPLAAQATVGTILGTVTDSSGAVIPGATVRITNAGTGAMQTTTSDGQGRYRVPALPVGDYDVQTEKAGFQTVVHRGITLTVGSEQVVDFAVPVGQVTQTVTVEGQVSQVETTSAEISNLVEPTQMRELPLNGRDLEQLVLLAPGVTVMQGIGQQAVNGFGNSYSISGSRTNGQWEILDDNDVMNFQGRGSGAGVLGTSLGIDAVAEFQVLTNTYSAQYGGNGGVVNSVTKSGTNALHGSAYEFFRNSALDARNFFDPATIPEFQKNQFGGTLGGPIKKDKMFFFANYEGLRQKTTPVYSFILPDAAAHFGFVPDSTGTYQCVAPGGAGLAYPSQAALCLADVPAGVRTFLPYFPLPSAYPSTTLFQAPNTINGLVNAFEPISVPGNENYVVGRYDWTISQKDSIFARYVFDKGVLFEANNTATLSPAAPQGWGTQDISKNQFLSVEEKRVWSNSLITSTRAGFSRTLNESYILEDYGSAWQWLGSNTYGFPVPADGAITIAALRNANFPHTTLGGTTNFNYIQNKFAGGEDIFWNKGAHGVRFGMSVTRVQTYKNTPPSNGGTWTFASITSLLQQAPSNYSGTCNPAFASCVAAGFSSAPAAPHEFLQTDFGFYVQDDWKVRNTLTLNLGLRYEPETNPTDAFGTMAAALNLPFSQSYNPALPMPGCTTPTLCPGTLPAGTTGYTPIHNVYLQNPSFHSFDPRIGIAWDPFKDHKTSVRAGYGIFHSPILPYDYTGGFTNPPPGTNVLQSCPSAAACNTFPIPFQAAGTFSPAQDGAIDNGDRLTGYMQQYNITVQREIAKNTTLSIGYVGSHGVHLIGETDENPNLPSGAPGAITVCAKGCNLQPGWQLLPYPALTSSFPVGTTGVPVTTGMSFQSAGGQAFVDPATGQMSYGNVVFKPATNTYSYVPNNRVDQAIGFWNEYRTNFWSSYNSLQAGLVRRLTNNAQVQLSYTYASCITNSSGTNGFEGQIVGSNAWNNNADRGPCSYMIRHNFYANGMYVLPFKKNRLVAGWQLGGIFQYHTGTPVFVSTGWFSNLVDRSGAAVSDNRPNILSGCQLLTKTLTNWVNPACFAMAPMGEPGNVGMNNVFGPDSMTFDASLVKNTRISERFNLQFRAEAFNLFNRTNFRNPGQPAVSAFAQATAPVSAGLGTGSLPSNCSSTPSACSTPLATTGTINLTNTSSRQIQLGLKLLF